jgi:hypothetical protein
MLRDQLAVAALEERPPLGGHCLGILEVLLEDTARVTGVESVDLVHVTTLSSNRSLPLAGFRGQ